MYGSSERGFTLIELLIAVTIIGVAFTPLLEVLSSSASRYSSSRETFGNLVVLDRKLKEGNHQGLQVSRKRLPDFPAISEVVYSLDGLFFVRYEAR